AGANDSKFAPSMISDQTKTVGWGIFLLPYIEQDNVYQKYNFNAPFFYTNAAAGIDNQAVSNTKIKLYLCPSVPERSGQYSYTFSGPGSAASSWQAYAADYTPVAGISQSLVTYLGLTTTALGGPLQRDIKTSILSITDGTSNTILLAEIAGKNKLY